MSKFKNGTYLYEYKESLKGLDEELAQDIAISAETLASYYGEEYEDTILNAIRDCKIVVASRNKVGSNGKKTNIRETVDDVMRREDIYGSPYNEKKTPAYISEPVIAEKNDKLYVDKVKRMIVLPHYYSSEQPAFLPIAELSELCKSCVDEYTIHGKKIEQRTGLAVRTYELDENNKLVKMISSRAVEVEESINSYDARYMMRENHLEEYDLEGKKSDEALYLGSLSISLDLKDVIRRAEFTGDTTELKEVLAERGMDLNTFHVLQELLLIQ